MLDLNPPCVRILRIVLPKRFLLSNGLFGRNRIVKEGAFLRSDIPYFRNGAFIPYKGNNGLFTWKWRIYLVVSHVSLVKNGRFPGEVLRLTDPDEKHISGVNGPKFSGFRKNG